MPLYDARKTFITVRSLPCRDLPLSILPTVLVTVRGDRIKGAGAHEGKTQDSSNRTYAETGEFTRTRQKLFPGPPSEMRSLILFAGRINSNQ